MIATQHLHPMIVHFPIVIFLLLTALDVLAFLAGRSVTGREGWGATSTALAVLAGISAIVTFILGGMALDIAEAGGFHSEIAETHEGLGTTTAIAFAVWALIRIVTWWRNANAGRGATAIVALIEIVGSVLVIVTAYYGGLLVYTLGVNVVTGAGG
jgi:uncharacterized membrane protein